MTQPRLEFIDPAQLDDNPANWKFHPSEQLDALGELIDELGWLKPLVFNERTGHLVDGHGRKQRFAGRGQVPVFVVSLSPEDEAKALATLDPIGWVAKGDKSKFDALLKGNKLLESTKGGVNELLKSVSKGSSLLDQKEEVRPDEDSDITIPLDSIWATDNAWQVPSLLPEKQADQVPHPVWTWGSIGHKRPMPGTWHFYTSDEKFEPLWRKPQRVLASGPSAIIEPNFSLTDQTPFWQALWHIGRKRWLGRYWQQCGLRLFVDLNVDASLNDRHDAVGGSRPNLLGVPVGWRAYASRAHANNPEALRSEYHVAREHSGIESPIFLVVGGGKQVKLLAQEHGWVHVPEQLQLVHEKEGAA
jgi:Domain of unknown function (DUF4417)